MKKISLIAAAVAVFAFSMFGSAIKASAYRVLNTSIWECSGSGGNCLDTVIVYG